MIQCIGLCSVSPHRRAVSRIHMVRLGWTPVGSSHGGVEYIITTLPHDTCAARPSSHKLSSSDRATASPRTRDPVHSAPRTDWCLCSVCCSYVPGGVARLGQIGKEIEKSFPHLVTLVPGQGSGTDLVKVVGLLPGPGTETQQVHSEPGSSPMMTPL